MALLSSKTLIQGHALFLFLLAVYLTKSPEVVVESDLVFMLGELLRIVPLPLPLSLSLYVCVYYIKYDTNKRPIQDATPTLSRPQSPFALCGIVLIADALIDLVLLTKVPQVNEIIAIAEASRYQTSVSVPGAMRTNPFITRLATLYSEIWTLLSAARFCLFFAVSFFVYQSKPAAWGVAAGAGEAAAGAGLDQLKNRVVFTYGFLEMMFWLWVGFFSFSFSFSCWDVLTGFFFFF